LATASSDSEQIRSLSFKLKDYSYPSAQHESSLER
jgi:hypothetical protein